MTPGPARDALVCAHLPLARVQATKLAKRYRMRWTEDLTAYAYEGLVKAANIYDPERYSDGFTAFAATRIKWAIIDGLRRDSWGRNSRTHREHRYAPVASLDQISVHVRTGDETLSLEEVLSGGDGPESELEHGWDAEVLREEMDELSTRQQLVLHLHYWEGWPLRQIGEHLGVTESRISQIVSGARERLRGSLAGKL